MENRGGDPAARQVTKPLTDGRTAVITPRLHWTGYVHARVTIDGRHIDTGPIEPIHRPDPAIPERYTRRIGVLMLTPEEAAAVAAMLAELQAAHPLPPPDPIEADRPTRERLVYALQGAVDEAFAARRRSHESEDGFALASPLEGEGAITAAEQALQDFDAAHPELLARLKAEYEARIGDAWTR